MPLLAETYKYAYLSFFKTDVIIMPLKEEDNQKYYETLMEILDVRRELKKINTCEIRGKEFTIHFMAI